MPPACSAFDDIAGRVLDLIAERPRPGRALGDEARFADLTLAVFAFQYEANAPYRAFCDRRGRTPATIRAGRTSRPCRPPRSSRSTSPVARPRGSFAPAAPPRAATRRGRHLVPRLEIYRNGALAHFRRMVLPDGARPRIVGLLGGPELLPDSSLTQMVEWLREDVAAGDGEYLVDAAGFDAARAADRIVELARDGRPLCLIGVRVVLTALLDHCMRRKAHARAARRLAHRRHRRAEGRPHALRRGLPRRLLERPRRRRLPLHQRVRDDRAVLAVLRRRAADALRG